MHTQALLGLVLASPSRVRDGDSIRTATALMQTRLTPGAASHASVAPSGFVAACVARAVPTEPN